MAKNTLPEPETPLAADDAVVMTADVPPEPAPVTDPQPDTLPDTLQPVSIPVRRGGFLAPLVGGALAAVMGFALSHYDALGLRDPVAIVEMTAALDRQAAELARLADALATAEAGLADRLTRAEAEIAALPAPVDPDPALNRLNALEERLAAIEAMPVTGTASSPALQAAIGALERRVQDLSATAGVPDELSARVDTALRQLADAEAEAAASSVEAETLAATARRNVLLDQLAAAIHSGAPYDAVLAELAGEAVPDPLARNAATGIVTLAALTDSFAAAARATLLEARASSGEDGWGTRLTDFLMAQTGARSLTPREGSDPDAILSRAEAAVRDGRLADALTELGGLDPQIAVPMAGWMAQAMERVEAEAALAALAARTEPQGE